MGARVLLQKNSESQDFSPRVDKTLFILFPNVVSYFSYLIDYCYVACNVKCVLITLEPEFARSKSICKVLFIIAGLLHAALNFLLWNLSWALNLAANVCRTITSSAALLCVDALLIWFEALRFESTFVVATKMKLCRGNRGKE